MNKLFYLIAFAAVSLVMAACSEDEKGSYPPTYYGFDYYPKPASAGDSVTITAVQAKKGHHLNATDYQLSVRVRVDENGSKDSTIVCKYHTNYDGTDNGSPTFKVKIPDNTISNSAAVTFTARWSNSSDGQGGIFRGAKGQGYLGSIDSYSYTLYSDARGTFNLPIKQ